MKMNLPAKKNSVTLIACAKNEGPYLVEWVCYHKLLGIDNILIASHDNIDGSENLLEELHDRQIIEYHNYTNRLPSDKLVQLYMYEQLTNSVKKRALSNWIIAIDIDEFLVLKKHKTIQSFIKQYPKNVDAISLSWEMFNSSGQIEMSPDFVTDRFESIAAPLPNVKTIARTEKINTWNSPHTPMLYNDMVGKHIYTNGQPYYKKTLFNMPLYFSETATINHYVLKSLKEFLIKNDRGGGTNFVTKNSNKNEMETRQLNFYYFMNLPQGQKNTDIKKTNAYKKLASTVSKVRDKTIIKIEKDTYESQRKHADSLYKNSVKKHDDEEDLTYIKEAIERQNQTNLIKDSYISFFDQIKQTDTINILHSRSRGSLFLANKIKSWLKKDEYFVYKETKRRSDVCKMNKQLNDVDLKKIRVIFSQHPIDEQLSIFGNKKIIPIILAESPKTIIFEKYNKQLNNIVELKPQNKNKYIKRYQKSKNFISFVMNEADNIMLSNNMTFFPYQSMLFMPSAQFTKRHMYETILDYRQKIICVENTNELQDFIDFICSFFSRQSENKKILKRYQGLKSDALIPLNHALFKNNRFLEMRLSIYIREYLSLLYFWRVNPK